MKSALQQAIDDLNELMEAQSPLDTRARSVYRTAINTVTLLLPAERQQIQAAYMSGSTVRNIVDTVNIQTAADYFTKTYNQ